MSSWESSEDNFDNYRYIIRIFDFLRTHIKVLGVTLLVLGLVAVYIYKIIHQNLTSCQIPTFSQSQSIDNVTSENLFVYVSGAVTNPGVYELEKGTRLRDALALAGPITNEASVLWVSKVLNLAQPLEEDQKIYVPFESDLYDESMHQTLLELEKLYLPETEQPRPTLDNNDIKTLNVNTATQSQLNELPGIGDAYSEKIISNRPYADLTDLISKTKISATVVKKFEHLINF